MQAEAGRLAQLVRPPRVDESAALLQVDKVLGMERGVKRAQIVDYEIALINLDATGFVQLTSDGKQKFLPHFSPDGRKILYTKFIVGGDGSPAAVTEIAVLDLASGQETIVTSGGNNGYGTWSPDGSRIAYLRAARLGSASTEPTTMVSIDVDGGDPQPIGGASGAPDDWVWGDIAWSRDDWILFVVGQTVDGSFCNSRVDKIRPDGSERTQVPDGGQSCTPPGKEAIGDADPGWSSDGQTIYSSRGLALVPAGLPESSLVTERKLYAFSSDRAWHLHHGHHWQPPQLCCERVRT